jgi:hypothetical protein
MNRVQGRPKVAACWHMVKHVLMIGIAVEPSSRYLPLRHASLQYIRHISTALASSLSTGLHTPVIWLGFCMAEPFYEMWSKEDLIIAVNSSAHNSSQMSALSLV